jgi:hypothetical protein
MLISLNRQHRNIAVRLSGGPDSAIIYHAVCDFYKDDPSANIYPYTMASPLRPHAIRKAQDVIRIVNRLTGRMATQHYTLFHDNHNAQNAWDINSHEYTQGQEDLEAIVFDELEIDARYAGMSINCPAFDMMQMVTTMSDNLDQTACLKSLETRDVSRDVSTATTICNFGNITMYLPFAESDKRVVYSVYQDYNVLDELYPYTWSCENDMQAQHTDPEHCGTCYFCLERLYAFGKL